MSLEYYRLQYQPELPEILKDIPSLEVLSTVQTASIPEEILSLFPQLAFQPYLQFKKGSRKEHAALRVGVVLSGGQAAGGHNVITGIFDALKKLNSASQLFGFLNGPSGIINGKVKELTADVIDRYRNLGGFDMIGSGRTKIETNEQFAAALNTVKNLKLDGLVIIGGDDSNTNAALLAEYFLTHGVSTRVVGVPKTIDGDLRNEFVEISFGFDSATKTYAEIIGNIARDALSAKKYYYFIKVMGRSASHIALECALKTQPNITLIGEEIAERKQTLKQVASEIADSIVKRHESGKEFGVILIPEGIIEFIPEVNQLIQELNRLLAQHAPEEVVSKLSEASASCFNSLPHSIQEQLLLDRDPHGNVQVSKIETERLFIEIVKEELQNRNFQGKFSAQPHFCGYEGRSCYPSNFDSQYCYALGHAAAVLINAKATGLMSCVSQLIRPVKDWSIAGIPLISMMDLEERGGKYKPVIKKALIQLNDADFQYFASKRQEWALQENYTYPGSIQFFGPEDVSDSIPETLRLRLQKG